MTTHLTKTLQDYINLPKDKKILWLSYLMFFISMDGRSHRRYIEKNKDADQRALILGYYVELLHRIASFQMSVVIHQKYTIPDDVFFQDLYDDICFMGNKPEWIFNDIRVQMAIDAKTCIS